MSTALTDSSMVLDLLTAIGLKEAGSYVAKDVLLPLLQGSLEDYAKDFFKGSYDWTLNQRTA